MDPVATYRLQLQPGFGFAEAEAVVGYLADLGVSHVYCSPYLQANTGSTHGYDVVDHGRINEDLGGETEFRRFCESLNRLGLKQLVDIVPNHMAVGPRNPWWWDVLENGPSSRYAAFFDVEWAPPEERLRNRMLLPVLGDHYGRILESGQLQLRREGGSFTLHYHEHSFPVTPRSVAMVLQPAAERCHSPELAFIADAFAALPKPTAMDLSSVDRRHRDKEVLMMTLTRMCNEEPTVATAIDAEIDALMSDFNAFDEFLLAQNCRLAFWKSGSRELGYRRFFDVSGLVGLRVEDGRVFDETHRLILRLIDEGVVDGLRIDHPDGLFDPEGYFYRLRGHKRDLWIVAEKILMPHERLRASWPIDGTTGYEFMNLAGGLFVDPKAEPAFTRLFEGLTGEHASYGETEERGKRLVLTELLGSDLNRLTALFLQICEDHRMLRDYNRHECHEVLRETLIGFPVYRSYVWPGHPAVTPEDRKTVLQAVETAKKRVPDVPPDLFDTLAAILLLEQRGPLETELVCRLQQLSGAVMAKGVEDTTFYVYNRFIALNEVGGSPERFGTSLKEFHTVNAATARTKPRTLLATSTHDTKRSEDVRARLYLLSEIPDRWQDLVGRWMAENEKHRRSEMPDRNTEYLFYQTVVGAWPLSEERAVAFMEKAIREGKAHTSWTDPKPEFEDAVRDFVTAALGESAFVSQVTDFVDPLIEPGHQNSLALTLIRMTAPGIPDTYQGCDLWDHSLVDPDNRRTVNFDLRKGLLESLRFATPEQVLANVGEGAPKLWVIKQALKVRRRFPGCFGTGSRYKPVTASGPRAAHVVAFQRGEECVTVVPRWPIHLAGRWSATRVRIPAGRWTNVMTGEQMEGGSVKMADLLQRFPVALITREAPSP